MIFRFKHNTIEDARDALIEYAKLIGYKVYRKDDPYDIKKAAIFSRLTLALLTMFCWILTRFGFPKDHNVSIANVIGDEIWLPSFSGYASRAESEYVAIRHELTHAMRRKRSKFWSLKWLLSRKFRAEEEMLAYKESVMAHIWMISHKRWHDAHNELLMAKLFDDVGVKASQYVGSSIEAKIYTQKLKNVDIYVKHYAENMAGPLYLWTWKEHDKYDFYSWFNFLNIYLISSSFYCSATAHYDDKFDLQASFNYAGEVKKYHHTSNDKWIMLKALLYEQLQKDVFKDADDIKKIQNAIDAISGELIYIHQALEPSSSRLQPAYEE